MSPPDPGDATSSFDRAEVEAVLGSALLRSGPPLSRAARAPSRPRRAVAVLVGLALALPLLGCLGLLAGVAGAAPVVGGTADETSTTGGCLCR